jgi:hypothetical protein
MQSQQSEVDHEAAAGLSATVLSTTAARGAATEPILVERDRQLAALCVPLAEAMAADPFIRMRHAFIESGIEVPLL